jgi:hypothetical protein
VKLGAIVVIGSGDELLATQTSSYVSFGEPLACVEIVGISTARRIVERFLRAEVEAVSVLVSSQISWSAFKDLSFPENVTVQIVDDVCSALQQKLADYSRSGIEHSFINSADAYAETDLLDLFYFHRESRRAITRASDHGGPLALWVADCAKAQQSRFELLLGESVGNGAPYFIGGYVNRLTTPRDLRRLAEDTFSGVCERGPSGREISPGVWIDDGAEVHRGARIVGPAYIGCGAKVLDHVLVTRLSSIERGCCIDCGTVIEDSSILANTKIGIWLDVCHAIVRGNKIWSLEREVMVEVSDPSIMRSTTPVRVVGPRTSELHEAQKIVENSRTPEPTRSIWQFGVQSYPTLSEE